MKNEIGSKYGRLTVTARAENNKRGLAYWLCICDCGASTTVSGANLRSGAVLSCGCLRIERVKIVSPLEIAGRRFGRLIVRRRSGSITRLAAWECLCDCGKTKIIAGCRLVQGRIISCGCAKNDHPGLLPTHQREAGVIRVARRRGHMAGSNGKFTKHDISNIYERQRGRCVWCRSQLKNRYHIDHRKPLSRGGANSADNIDLLCADCNLRKWSKAPEQWAREKGLLL